MCAHILHCPFPLPAVIGVKLHLCSAAELPKAVSQPVVCFGSLDSPLLGWFAVSVTATEKCSVACTVQLFQVSEVQHSLKGEALKPSLLQKSECLQMACARAHTHVPNVREMCL